MNPPTPTHDLEAIKEKVAVGFVHYRSEALKALLLSNSLARTSSNVFWR